MSAEQRARPSLPIRLLLIDERQDDYHLVCDLLDAVPGVTFVVDWARDLSSGRDVLENGQVDVCLIDHQLPDGDGLDLIEMAVVRAHPAPIVVLSSQGSVALDHRAMSLGASGFLDKTRLDPLLLERTIRYALRHQEMTRELREAALHDASTGLATPVLFRDRLTRALMVAKRQQTMIALVLIDVGDERQTGEQQRQHLVSQAHHLTRKLRKTDTVARLSARRIALVLEDLNSIEDAALVARKVLQELTSPIDQENSERSASPSPAPSAGPYAGIALYPDDGSDIDMLLRRAEKAMDEAKKAPAPDYSLGGQHVFQRETRRALLSEDFEQALERQALALRYRPLIHVADQRISLAAEILINDRDADPISRDRFLSIAHDRPLIKLLIDWCVGEAVSQLLAWQRQGLEKVYLSLPMLSSRADDVPVLERLIRQHLDDTPLAPDQLEIDLDQSFVLGDLEKGGPGLAALKATGIRLAVDEFGSDDACFHKIACGQLDSLKLSSTLYQDLPGATAGETLLKAIVNLGHDLDLWVVANGARDERQFAFLKEAGCDAIKLCAADSLLTADMFAALANKPLTSNRLDKKAGLARETDIAIKRRRHSGYPNPAAVKISAKTSLPLSDSP